MKGDGDGDDGSNNDYQDLLKKTDDEQDAGLGGLLR